MKIKDWFINKEYIIDENDNIYFELLDVLKSNNDKINEIIEENFNHVFGEKTQFKYIFNTLELDIYLENFKKIKNKVLYEQDLFSDILVCIINNEDIDYIESFVNYYFEDNISNEQLFNIYNDIDIILDETDNDNLKYKIIIYLYKNSKHLKHYLG